jgi:hypothetical protein
LTASEVATSGGALDQQLDLLDTFGPMSAMHAAMDRLGVGMPCGLVARFQAKTTADVEAAVEAARLRFPVLQRRVAWIGTRPVLVTQGASVAARASTISLAFTSGTDGPLWRYSLVQDGDDTWLAAIWAHAAADGHSMLRLLETIGAAENGVTDLQFQSQVRRREHGMPMAFWLVRFLIEQHLPYVHVAEANLQPAGIAWTTVSSGQSASLLERVRLECGSFGAWLGAAACMAFCEQQSVSSGRVLLNLPILRSDLEKLGGFGFGAGSLLMPVKLERHASLPAMARSISRRLKQMIEQGWDQNFERFLGNDPRRHLRFAARHARRRSAPVVSVSWKGTGWRVGGENGIRDAACFAVSPAAHISGHIDRNGLSLSAASSRSGAQCEDLLRRLARRIGTQTKRIYTFDGAAVSVRTCGA